MTAETATAWKIPEPHSARDVAVDDGTVITLRRHGNPAGPRLVLCHGNGLAIDLYYPFWSLLTDEFDLVVYDLRNHGWNSVGNLREHNIPTLVRDHERILEAIDGHFGDEAENRRISFRFGSDHTLVTDPGKRILGARPVRSAPVQAG